MKQLLKVDPNRNYSYEFLSQFFGGEENVAGVSTPEVELKCGTKTIILTFECDRTEIGDRTYVPRVENSYKIVEMSSYEK